MPPSSLSPAIELLQLNLRIPGNLQPARCDPWFKDGWRVPADVMLHAEEILRASYSGPPKHAREHMFLAYAHAVDRNLLHQGETRCVFQRHQSPLLALEQLCSVSRKELTMYLLSPPRVH